METHTSAGSERPRNVDLRWYERNEPRCFRSAEANCGPEMFAYDFETGVFTTNIRDKDPAENGFHCCMLPLGHEGPCFCDECCRPFTPDGVLRTIGEIRNAH
jgi:hypothetical protein